MVRKKQNKQPDSKSDNSKDQSKTLDHAVLGTPDFDQEKLEQVIVKTAMEVSFSGPLPPPEMLGEYDKVLPGAADRIIRLAEKEQDLRGHDNRRMVQRDNLMIGGSVAVSLAIVAGIVLCAYFGQPFIGSVLVIIGLLPAVFKSISDFKRLMSRSEGKTD